MLRALFVLTLLGAGFAGALWSRHIALLTYVWLALFRPLEWIWLDLNAVRPSLLAGLLLLLPCLVSGQFPNARHPVAVLAWLFTGTVVVAQLSSNYAGDWSWVDQFVRLVIVSGLAITLLNSRERLVQYVAVAAGSLAFFSAKAGIVSMMGGGVRFGAGQAGSFIDSNGYALAINMAIPLMAASAVNVRNLPFSIAIRWGFVAAIPFSVFAIFGTMSRAGLVALGALALVFALLQRRPPLWIAGLAVVSVLMYRYAPMPEGYMERMETIQTYGETGERSAISRFHFWQVAVDMVKANPLGVGLRRYDRAYNDYDFLNGDFGRGRSVHSSHFQVLAEVGYVGLGLWVGLFGCAMAICLRIRYAASRQARFTNADRRFYVSMATALATSMFAFLVGGAFVALANNDLTWLTFAAVVALERQFKAESQSIPVAAAIDPVPVRVMPVRPKRPAVA